MPEIDYACENHLGCLDSICTDYGSVRDLEPASNRLMCKSGAVGRLENKGTVCIPTPTIVDKEAPTYQCTSPTDTCLYESKLS